MILRIWRTKVNIERIQEYERFEMEHSLPMFRRQHGLMGVLFLREGADHSAALTLWENLESIEALDTSTSYQQTAGALGESGLLVGEQSVQIFEIRGGEIQPQFTEALRW